MSPRSQLRLATCRVLWGTTLVLAPVPLLELVHGPDEGASRVVVRALGCRHLAQGVVELLAGVGPLGMAADACHALSALGFALADRRWRSAALVDASVAGAFAAASAFVRPS